MNATYVKRQLSVDFPGVQVKGEYDRGSGMRWYDVARCNGRIIKETVKS